MLYYEYKFELIFCVPGNKLKFSTKTKTLSNSKRLQWQVKGILHSDVILGKKGHFHASKIK